MSDEIESLTAQLAELRDGRLDDATGFIRRLEVENDRLRSQLAECRDKALEEAVQVCENEYERFQKMDQFNYAENSASADQGCTSCAEVIRSLKETKP
jgi:regulator of replication initiation timing